jgi:hypothetical protein
MNITRDVNIRSQVGRWIAIVSWALVVLANLFFFLLDLDYDYTQMLVPCADALGFGAGCNFLAISSAEVAVLTSWGLTTRDHAIFMITLPVILVLVYWALAGLILWRQGSSRFGLTVSLALIVLPISTISGSHDWSANNPALIYLGVAIAILGTTIEVIFLYLMPNGRFSPRWAYIPLACTILLVTGLTLEINGLITVSSQILALMNISTIGLVLLGGGFQITRYLQDSSSLERQQTKWILFGILAYVLSVMLWVLIFGGGLAIPAGKPRLLANLGGWFIISFSLLILPAMITIAILRYRLWDIDLIVRKTLIYAVLSGLLALVYFGLVVLLQSVFDSVSGQQSAVVIVISTLAIAALFAPLRRRVQDFIDRRFFRKKYDAQQVLAEFAQTAQDEVNMEALQVELLRVVQETMQPEKISLWTKRRLN